MSDSSPETGVPILTDVPEQLPPLADPIDPPKAPEPPDDDLTRRPLG